MDKKDIKIFLDNIYERGTGSWNTLPWVVNGESKSIRVVCNSSWYAIFEIHNQIFDYEDAIDYLINILMEVWKWIL